MKTLKGFILGVITTLAASIVTTWFFADEKLTSKVTKSALDNVIGK